MDYARKLRAPKTIEVIIDTPRGSFIKRTDSGAIDFISPLPSPFNYGSVPGTRAGDGDREDALVLGPKLPRHTRLTVPVVAQVHFLDAGQEDPKWICSPKPLTSLDRYQLHLFFHLYTRAKRLLNSARRTPGPTQYRGLTDLP